MVRVLSRRTENCSVENLVERMRSGGRGSRRAWLIPGQTARQEPRPPDPAPGFLRSNRKRVSVRIRWQIRGMVATASLAYRNRAADQRFSSSRFDLPIQCRTFYFQDGRRLWFCSNRCVQASAECVAFRPPRWPRLICGCRLRHGHRTAGLQRRQPMSALSSMVPIPAPRLRSTTFLNSRTLPGQW